MKKVLLLLIILIMGSVSFGAETESLYLANGVVLQRLDVSTGQITTAYSASGYAVSPVKISETEYVVYNNQNNGTTTIMYTSDDFVTKGFYNNISPRATDIFYSQLDQRFYIQREGVGIQYITKQDMFDGSGLTFVNVANGLMLPLYQKYMNEDFFDKGMFYVNTNANPQKIVKRINDVETSFDVEPGGYGYTANYLRVDGKEMITIQGMNQMFFYDIETMTYINKITWEGSSYAAPYNKPNGIAIALLPQSNKYMTLNYNVGENKVYKTEKTLDYTIRINGSNYSSMSIDNNYLYFTGQINGIDGVYKIAHSDLSYTLLSNNTEAYNSQYVVNSGVYAVASPAPEEPSEYIIYKNNQPIVFPDVQPVLDGRLVPLRHFALSFSFSVYWDQETRQGVIRKGDLEKKEIIFTLGSSDVLINGKAYVLSQPAQVIDGRFMIPARDLVKAFETVEYKDVVVSPVSVQGQFYYQSKTLPEGLDPKYEGIPTITEFQKRDLVYLSDGVETTLAKNHTGETDSRYVTNEDGQTPATLTVEEPMLIVGVPKNMSVHIDKKGNITTLSGELYIVNYSHADIYISDLRFQCGEGWILKDIETDINEIRNGPNNHKKYGVKIGFGSIDKMVKVLPVVKCPDIDTTEWGIIRPLERKKIFYEFAFGRFTKAQTLNPTMMIIDFDFVR